MVYIERQRLLHPMNAAGLSRASAGIAPLLTMAVIAAGVART
jgi:hypothetical protein